jgi:hypothetical protein
MMVSEARVPLNAQVHWTILKMAMQMETEILRPQLTELAQALNELQSELAEMVKSLDALVSEVDPVIQAALQIKTDMEPLWDDAYTLCGNPECGGDCRVCMEGEEDYEDDTEEKYCRRRRR